ncbi:unnamed protein product [Anisakis simplex]|uniref:Uncharacterized protein n=1 Tax=Anisakis simplex TaxID=6269 RepID=A0A0M3J281_ANISI|nr:unnamed protein product [Anisakis simplex]
MMHVLQLAGIPRLSILREFYVNRVRERRDQLLAICQRGRAALLKPAERRTLSKKRPTRRDDGSRSDSDEDTTALTPKHKRERTTTTTTTATTTTTGTDKDTPSELNFLED